MPRRRSAACKRRLSGNTTITTDEIKMDSVDAVNTDVITKIKNTFHTAGINSFSMYRYLTQPVDGIPGRTKTRYQSLSFNNLIRKNIIEPSKSANVMDVNSVTNFSCYLGTFFTHSLDLDRLLTVEYQHLLPRSSAQRYHFPN